MTKPNLELELLRIAALQQELVREGGFYLAGGSGLSIRLGHRFSEDLDWFTPKPFSANELADKLGALSKKPSKIQKQGPHTLRAYYGTLETSFIRYTAVKARPERVLVRGQLIPVADLALAAAMKAAAVYNRGTKRDFIDIHAICQLPGWSMTRFIDDTTHALQLTPANLTRALLCFGDAEQQPMPRGYTTDWEQVKKGIIEGVRAWERDREHGRER